MSCEQTQELLPWLLNHTLEPAERTAIEDHLAGCRRCAMDAREVADWFELVSQHVPSFELAGYALGWTAGKTPHEVIERHLAICQSCRLETAAVRSETPFGYALSARRARRPMLGQLLRLSPVASAFIVFGLSALFYRPAEDPRVAFTEVSSEVGSELSLPSPREVIAGSAGLFLDGFEQGTTFAWSQTGG